MGEGHTNVALLGDGSSHMLEHARNKAQFLIRFRRKMKKGLLAGTKVCDRSAGYVAKRPSMLV